MVIGDDILHLRTSGHIELHILDGKFAVLLDEDLRRLGSQRAVPHDDGRAFIELEAVGLRVGRADRIRNIESDLIEIDDDILPIEHSDAGSGDCRALAAEEDDRPLNIIRGDSSDRVCKRQIALGGSAVLFDLDDNARFLRIFLARVTDFPDGDDDIFRRCAFKDGILPVLKHHERILCKEFIGNGIRKAAAGDETVRILRLDFPFERAARQGKRDIIDRAALKVFFIDRLDALERSALDGNGNGQVGRMLRDGNRNARHRRAVAVRRLFKRRGGRFDRTAARDRELSRTHFNARRTFDLCIFDRQSTVLRMIDRGCIAVRNDGAARDCDLGTVVRAVTRKSKAISRIKICFRLQQRDRGKRAAGRSSSFRLYKHSRALFRTDSNVFPKRDFCRIAALGQDLDRVLFLFDRCFPGRCIYDVERTAVKIDRAVQDMPVEIERIGIAVFIGPQRNAARKIGLQNDGFTALNEILRKHRGKNCKIVCLFAARNGSHDLICNGVIGFRTAVYGKRIFFVDPIKVDRLFVSAALQHDGTVICDRIAIFAARDRSAAFDGERHALFDGDRLAFGCSDAVNAEIERHRRRNRQRLLEVGKQRQRLIFSRG